jgi:hypothetical protein
MHEGGVIDVVTLKKRDAEITNSIISLRAIAHLGSLMTINFQNIQVSQIRITAVIRRSRTWVKIN